MNAPKQRLRYNVYRLLIMGLKNRASLRASILPHFLNRKTVPTTKPITVAARAMPAAILTPRLASRMKASSFRAHSFNSSLGKEERLMRPSV
jgi:hypothetical protein